MEDLPLSKGSSESNECDQLEFLLKTLSSRLMIREPPGQRPSWGWISCSLLFAASSHWDCHLRFKRIYQHKEWEQLWLFSKDQLWQQHLPFHYLWCQHDWESSKIKFFSLGTVLANWGVPVCRGREDVSSLGLKSRLWIWENDKIPFIIICRLHPIKS